MSIFNNHELRGRRARAQSPPPVRSASPEDDDDDSFQGKLLVNAGIFFLIAALVICVGVVVFQILGSAFMVAMSSLHLIAQIIAAVYFWVFFATVVSVLTMGTFLLMKKYQKRLPSSVSLALEVFDLSLPSPSPSPYVPPPETVRDPLARAKYLSNGAQCVRVGAVCQSVEILLRQDLQAAQKKNEELEAKVWSLRDELSLADYHTEDANTNKDKAIFNMRAALGRRDHLKKVLEQKEIDHAEKVADLNAEHSRELCQIKKELVTARASLAELEGTKDALAASVQKCKEQEEMTATWAQEAVRVEAFSDWVHGENDKLQEQIEATYLRNRSLELQNADLALVAAVNTPLPPTRRQARERADAAATPAAIPDPTSASARAPASPADLALAAAVNTPLPPTPREAPEETATAAATPGPGPVSAPAPASPGALALAAAGTPSPAPASDAVPAPAAPAEEESQMVDHPETPLMRNPFRRFLKGKGVDRGDGAGDTKGNEKKPVSAGATPSSSKRAGRSGAGSIPSRRNK